MLRFIENMSQAILNNQNNARVITIPNFKTYYNVVIYKTALYCQKKMTCRLMEQNRNPKS